MSGGNATTPPAASDGGCLPGGVSSSCNSTPCACGTTRWLDAQAYCGDRVRLESTFTGNCVDGPATVEILHPSNGSVVDTISSTIQGGRVTAVWIAKAQTANWRTDRIRFRVQAAGLTCASSNEFTFRQRPVTNWTLLDLTHVKTNAALGSVFEYHDAKVDPSRVYYKVKIKVSGDPFNATKQAAAKASIEAPWNDGFTAKAFHRTGCARGRSCDCVFDCCKAAFHLDVDFVTSGEHLLVTVIHTAPGATRQGSSTAAAGGRPITGTWGDPPRNDQSTYAHEIGHILGHFDEYTPPVGGNDPTGQQPVSPAAGDENLMSTSGNTRLLNRHYRRALVFLNSNAGGDPYEIIPP